MSDLPIAAYPDMTETISARVLDECRQTWGSVIDDSILQAWVTSTMGTLLTEQTRVTQFVQVLALRDIRDRANRYISGGG